jgi:ribosomal protein S13
MIQRTDAIDVLNKNIDRTNSLIAAMEKIGAYNRIYQMNVATQINSQFANIVSEVQKEELSRIEQSCSEHAIISLSTAFETYYKELLQQLLFLYPEFFLSRHTKYTDSIQELSEGQEQFSYEHIELKLNLRSRFDYYKFFQAYSISLLEVKEVEFIEYLYVKRNNFVHNAGKIDEKTQRKLKSLPKPVDDSSVTTEVKRLRTKFTKMMILIDKRIKESISKA